MSVQWPTKVSFAIYLRNLISEGLVHCHVVLPGRGLVRFSLVHIMHLIMECRPQYLRSEESRQRARRATNE